MWINRHAEKTTVTISYPDNEIARASVGRYIAMLTQVFARAVETSDQLGLVAPQADSYEPYGPRTLGQRGA